MNFTDSVDAMMTKNPNWSSTGLSESRVHGHRRNPKANPITLWRRSMDGAFGNIEIPEWVAMLKVTSGRRKPNMKSTRRVKPLAKQLQGS